MVTTLSAVAQYTLAQRHSAAAAAPNKKKASPPKHADKAGFAPADDALLRELRAAIPPELFERSLAKSLAWLAHDVVLAAALFWGATRIHAWYWWPAYWCAQGVVLTGVWVLAHECGHQGFSPYRRVNNAIGWVLHSFLLVPYHSWRITHGKHHKNTNHLTQDQVFVPPTRAEVLAADPKLRDREQSADFDPAHDSLLEASPLANLVGIIVMLTLGWPAYLVYNVSGQKYPKWASHFFPSSPFFARRDYADVVWSSVGVVLALAGLGWCAVEFGPGAVMRYYGVPYLIVNIFLVLITFLQHTHVDLPHYDAASFTFVRGALATMDRSYGPILNYFHHNIADSHVCHHLFSTMPFYNAKRATPIIRAKLAGTPWYREDRTPIVLALWRAWRDCKYVEPAAAAGPGVYWYNN